MSKSKVIYCTYFDKGYLLKGLALHASLIKYDPSAKLWVLCMDEYTKTLLDRMKLRGVTTVALKDFEDKELKTAKSNRSLVEYYWTCTPSVPLYVLKHNPTVDIVAYLDADLFFYTAPQIIIDELNQGSMYIVEHRYPPAEQYRDNVNGRFNVAVTYFRNDKNGIACMKDWRAKCNEWCYLKEEPGRFGDQLYLNEWPHKFKGVVISQNLGVDAAPWNIAKYSVTSKNNSAYIDHDQLVVYHFHQLDYFAPGQFDLARGYKFSHAIENYIYKPYLKTLDEVYAKVKKIDSDFRLIPPKRSISVKIKSKVSKYFGPLYWRLRGLIQ